MEPMLMPQLFTPYMIRIEEFRRLIHANFDWLINSKQKIIDYIHWTKHKKDSRSLYVLVCERPKANSTYVSSLSWSRSVHLTWRPPSVGPDHSSDEMEDDLSPHVPSFHEIGDCRDRFSSVSFFSPWWIASTLGSWPCIPDLEGKKSVGRS